MRKTILLTAMLLLGAVQVGAVPAVRPMLIGYKGTAPVLRPRLLQTCNDISRLESGVADILAGRGDLPCPFTGKGVVVGLFDVGIDAQNINFADARGESRIRRIWHYSSDNGIPTEYISANQIKSFISDDREDTHGTHVLGTITSSFGGQIRTAEGDMQNIFTGMAPEAEIAVACGQLYDSNIADGCRRIVEYAKSVGKPCVINLSLSDVLGPHDGSDALSATLTELAEDAIIVVSIGNEHGKDRSISRTLTEDKREIKTFILPEGWHPWCEGGIAIWANDERAFKLSVGIYDRISDTYTSLYQPTIGNEVILRTSDCEKISYGLPDAGMDAAYTNSWVEAYVADNRETNKRFSAAINFDIDIHRTLNQHYDKNLFFKVEGEPGQRIDVNMYTDYGRFSKLWIEDWDEGADVMSYNSLACAENVISVGAYEHRTEWTDLAGNHFQSGDRQGDIASFSSYGSDIFGNNYPTAVGPGVNTISTASTLWLSETEAGPTTLLAEANQANGKKMGWIKQSGTSMAAPVVSGAIALWLQADPTLTAVEAIDIINMSSTTTHPGFAENPEAWGAGRFNAQEGLKEVLKRSALPMTEASDELSLRTTSPGTWQILDRNGLPRQGCLFNLQGIPLSSGTTLSAPSNGVYIITTPGKTFKVQVGSL